ncbi:hypothetical protein V462_06505 [Pantoea ananatis 15320]|nr:hypothetical protein V462_06505 [Pantoea ananatis 15320]
MDLLYGILDIEKLPIKVVFGNLLMRELQVLLGVILLKQEYL